MLRYLLIDPADWMGRTSGKLRKRQPSGRVETVEGMGRAEGWAPLTSLSLAVVRPHMTWTCSSAALELLVVRLQQ
jgi:hypothetical protein